MAIGSSTPVAANATVVGWAASKQHCWEDCLGCGCSGGYQARVVLGYMFLAEALLCALGSVGDALEVD